MTTANNNVARFGFFANWMFKLQRLTGLITIVFIAHDIWETRVQIGQRRFRLQPDGRNSFHQAADL